MGISSLLRLKPYADLLVSLQLVDNCRNIPSIPLLQELIELAWSIGQYVGVAQMVTTYSHSLISYYDYYWCS